MNEDTLNKHSHRRFNPLMRDWVLVSPGRTKRPWQGKVEQPAAPTMLSYDPHCYLCPGNVRANGARNPRYAHTFTFTNDYSALDCDAPEVKRSESGLLLATSERGVCKVLCFSPFHNAALSEMDPMAIRSVVNAWIEERKALEEIPWVQHIQIFENRGSMMGASNPHPHCQIWATDSIPNIAARELLSFETHVASHGTCLLCDYAGLERSSERLVCENDSFVALVPYWATWPFELLVIAKRHFSKMSAFTSAEEVEMADMLKQVTLRYDLLFNTPFPYTMGFHEGPAKGNAQWHFHAHYYPPLLRSATVQKFMVGFELLAMPQRDILPEEAAARLRATVER